MPDIITPAMGGQFRFCENLGSSAASPMLLGGFATIYRERWTSCSITCDREATTCCAD